MKLARTFSTFLLVLAAPLFINAIAQGQTASPGEVVRALMDQNVGDEMELVDDQEKNIRSLARELIAIRTVNGEKKQLDFRNAPASDRQKIEQIYSKRFQESESKIAERMKNVLLPFQIERMEQAVFQKKLKDAKNLRATGLLTRSMIEYLDIKDEQQTRIAKRSRELNAEIEMEFRKIVKRAREKLLNELTTEQRSKYEELIGDPIKSEGGKPNTKAGLGK
jgi:hypothetical protein